MKNRASEFAALVAKLRNKPGVTLPSGDEVSAGRFGSNGLRINGRIFAILSSENRVVAKLPRARVEALVASGERGPVRSPQWPVDERMASLEAVVKD